MTPLETPPPPSGSLQVAPPLKQQSDWTVDDSELIVGSPSFSFPLLVSHRNAMPTTAALATTDQDLPVPLMPMQPFEFLNFPSLKREVAEHEKKAQDARVAAMPRPVPIRPLDCFRGRSPSLQLIIDNELNRIPNETTSATNQTYRHKPQWRVQPLKSGAETPSHLARRGIEERTYLENQLRAEESRRRMHQWENEERKAWEKNVGEEGDDNDGHDVEISALMEKFTGFHLGNEMVQLDCLKRFIPDKSKYMSRSRDSAIPSPPIILQKSFKRSVSAVIADSRGLDDQDACVLYFPDGLPLVDECNEGLMSSRDSHGSFENVLNCHSFDLESHCSLSPHTHDITEGSTPFGTISCHSSPTNSVEFQPVLIGGEGESTASIYPLLKGNNKKVMLRPKMTARPKTPAKLTQLGGDCNGKQDNQVTIPDQIECNRRLEHLRSELSGLSPNFGGNQNQLKKKSAGWKECDVREEKECLSERQMDDTFERNVITEKFNTRIASSHYHTSSLLAETADHSETSRCSHHTLESEATIVRKNGTLGTSNSVQLSFGEKGDRSESLRLPCHSTNSNLWDYSSPDLYCKSLSTKIFHLDNQDSARSETLQIELKEPLSESNYWTPDHSNGIRRKHLGVKLSGALDTLPELFLPNLEKRPQQDSLLDNSI
ncbi:hypothetical protein ACHAWX_004129 [Stephanocyclus meneghinianus]